MYKVGYIGGVFDLFHVGHLNVLSKSKEKCEKLIVGVLADELVLHFKKNEPIIPLEQRMKIIGALKCVDEVVEINFENIDKMDSWNQLKYDCLFSGNDYINNKQWIKDKKRLEAVGSTIEFFPYSADTSSTEIKNKIREKIVGVNK